MYLEKLSTPPKIVHTVTHTQIILYLLCVHDWNEGYLVPINEVF